MSGTVPYLLKTCTVQVNWYRSGRESRWGEGGAGQFTGVGALVATWCGTSKLFGMEYTQNASLQGKASSVLLLTMVSNIVLLSCQPQFINYEYRVPICMLENLVNLVAGILDLFLQPLVSFFCLNLK